MNSNIEKNINYEDFIRFHDNMQLKYNNTYKIWLWRGIYPLTQP